MFNYEKEIIINDINKVAVLAGTDTIMIKRGANYEASKIKDATIYKTEGVAGSVASVEIDPSKLTTADVDRYLYTMFVSTPSKEFVEHAFPNYQEFGRPVVIETSAVTAAGIAEAFKLALPNDNPFYSVEVASSKVVLTFKESWFHVQELNVVGLTEDGAEVAQTTSGLVSITQNVEDFATAKWIVENLRFPSYPNLRYNRLYADESPVAGAVYDQYTFTYCVPNAFDGGVSGVGQIVDSETHHVLYVNHAIASAFDTLLVGILDSDSDPVLTIDTTSHAV